MITNPEIVSTLEAPPPSAPLTLPTNSTEFINLLAHYYRGEMSRMISWRDRIDRTTNWAIAAVAAMLSVSLASPEAHHGVLIFAMLLVFLLLYIESRRYRFFDVYRTRVRALERNYYALLFSPQGAILPAHWAGEISEGLQRPRFTITLKQAVARRLRRNYCWIFLILLLAWVLKTTTAVLQPQRGRAEFIHSPDEWLHKAAIGYIPGWVVLTSILAFYIWLLYVMVKHRKVAGELSLGEVHV